MSGHGFQDRSWVAWLGRLIGCWLVVSWGGMVWAIATAQTIHFQQTIVDYSPSIAFGRWVGGAVSEEKIEVVESPDRPGHPVIRISLIPSGGSYWYYRVPLNLPVEDDIDYVFEANMKFEVEGNPSPNLVVRLASTHSVFQDQAFTQVKEGLNSSVDAEVALYTPGIWESLRSRPFNRRKTLEKARGIREPFVRMDGLFIGITHQNIGQRITIWIDGLTLRTARESDRAASEDLLDGYIPQAYPVQTDHFYYGAWGHLMSGNYPWHRHLKLMPDEARMLCAAEAAIEAGFNWIQTDAVQFDASNLPGIKKQIEMNEKLGLSSVCTTYFTPYYDRSRSLTDCEAAGTRIVDALKNESGLIAYYLIDEPRPDQHTLQYWLWGKRLIARLDPTRPATGFQNTLDSLAYYLPTEQTVAIDCYPFPARHFADTRGGNALELETWMDESQRLGPKGVWPILWSSGTLWSRAAAWRMPAAAETRQMTYVAMARGGRAVLHFCFMANVIPDRDISEGLIGIYNGVYDSPWDFSREVIRLGQIVPVFGPALIGTQWDPQAVVPMECGAVSVAGVEKPAIGYGLNQGKDYQLLVCYNRSISDRQVGQVSKEAILSLAPSHAGDRDVYDLVRGVKLETNAQGKIQIDLDAGDGMILMAASAKIHESVRSQCLKRQLDSQARMVRFHLAEMRLAGFSVESLGHRLQQVQTRFSTDTAKGLAELVAIRSEAEKLGKTDPSWTQAHRMLETAQKIYSDIDRQYCYHVVERGYPDALSDDDRRSWTLDMVKASNAYVLLRNAVFAGKIKESLPLLGQLNQVLFRTKANVVKSQYQFDDSETLDKVMNTALSTAPSAVELLECALGR